MYISYRILHKNLKNISKYFLILPKQYNLLIYINNKTNHHIFYPHQFALKQQKCNSSNEKCINDPFSCVTYVPKFLPQIT